MTHHYHQYAAFADQRQQQLQREASQHRLAQTEPAPGMGDYLLAALGEWMVLRGTALKQRIETMPAAAPQWSAGSQS